MPTRSPTPDSVYTLTYSATGTPNVYDFVLTINTNGYAPGGTDTYERSGHCGDQHGEGRVGLHTGFEVIQAPAGYDTVLQNPAVSVHGCNGNASAYLSHHHSTRRGTAFVTEFGRQDDTYTFIFQLV